MKFTLTLLLLLAVRCHSAFIPQENLSIFNTYHGLLSFIFNETKQISDAIANQIDDFLLASSAEPSEADEVIAEIFTNLMQNEPVMPPPPEETYDEIDCDEILGELQSLFELSKYFLLKAARNEESINTLKAVVIELLQSEYENMEIVADMVETIADNYRAQNHILATIKEVDREIEGEIASVAKFCNESRLVEEISGDY
jgi:hypothetical protein